MVSPFVALARAKLAPAFAHHGEEWAHQPMTPAADKTAPAVPDVTRPPQDLIGIYFEKPANPNIVNAYDPRADQRPGSQIGSPRVEFPPAPTNPNAFALRAGDILTRASNGRSYQVATPHVTKTGIVVAPINSLGTPS
jgi:hypothetical protein